MSHKNEFSMLNGAHVNAGKLVVLRKSCVTDTSEQ